MEALQWLLSATAVTRPIRSVYRPWSIQQQAGAGRVLAYNMASLRKLIVAMFRVSLPVALAWIVRFVAVNCQLSADIAWFVHSDIFLQATQNMLL
jgi:hypothetical protein